MWDGWHMGGMWLWWILAIVLVVVVVWGLTRSPTHTPPPKDEPRERTPEDILKERYARGELDAEEYRRRLDDLRK